MPVKTMMQLETTHERDDGSRQQNFDQKIIELLDDELQDGLGCSERGEKGHGGKTEQYAHPLLLAAR
jgi:hypothetical protein